MTKRNTNTMKKSAQIDANTARQNFSLRRRPIPGGAGPPKFYQLEIWSLPAPTDPVWWRSMHAISSYRGNRHRPPARPPQTHTDRTDHNTLRR